MRVSGIRLEDSKRQTTRKKSHMGLDSGNSGRYNQSRPVAIITYFQNFVKPKFLHKLMELILVNFVEKCIL